MTCDKFWFIDLRFKPKVNSLILNLSPHVIPNQACSLYFILNNILAGFFSTEWKKSVTRDREASQKSSTRLPNIIHTYTFYAASLNDAKHQFWHQWNQTPLVLTGLIRGCHASATVVVFCHHFWSTTTTVHCMLLLNNNI